MSFIEKKVTVLVAILALCNIVYAQTLEEDFTTLEPSVWTENIGFQLNESEGIIESYGTGATNTWSTIQSVDAFSPGSHISTRMKTSQGCNAGTIQFRFGKQGSDAMNDSFYFIQLSCDDAGSSYEHFYLYKVTNGTAEIIFDDEIPFQCLTWYKMDIVWESDYLEIELFEDDGSYINDYKIVRDFSQSGFVGFRGYRCSGMSAVDYIYITSPDLVAHYPLDGNADDISIYDNDGTVFGPMSASDGTGASNMAMRFDGVDDYIDIPITQISQLNEGSICGLFRIRDLSKVNCIFSIGNTVTTNSKSSITVSEEGVLRFHFRKSYSPPQYWYESDLGLIIENKWYHYVYTQKEGTGLKLYLNGQQISLNYLPDGSPTGDEFFSDFVTTPQVATFGAKKTHNYNDAFFNGEMDDIRFYRKVLSAEEVLAIYNEKPLGIFGKFKEPATIKVFPSPFDSQITVNFRTSDTEDIIIDIVDMNGRVLDVLYTGRVEAELDNQMSFSVKHEISQGLYLLRIRSSDGIHLGKVLIQKQ